jgi:PAS domain S-box-containing protein
MLTSLALGALVYTRISQTTLDNEIQRIAHETRFAALQFKSAYNQMENDAFVVSRTPPIKGLIRSLDNNGIDPSDGSTAVLWRARLATIFASVLKGRPTYTQMRYVAADTGRELVRVNRTRAGIETVEYGDLQDKSGEPYFKTAFKLQPGEIYFSEVAYNREHGRIDESKTPTLRAVLPIYDSDESLFGMLVINADYGAMLHAQLESIALERRILLIHNAEDYIERSADGKISEFRFQEEHHLPPAFRDAAEGADDEWMLRTADQVVYSVRLKINDPGNRRQAKSQVVAAIAVPNSELYAEARRAGVDSLFLAVGLMLLSLLITVWLSTRFTEPLRTMANAAREATTSKSTLRLPTNRKDEIGELAVAFQELTDSLVQSEAQIARKTRQITASEEVFRTAMESAPIGMAISTMAGDCIAANPALCRLLGYSEAEMKASNLRKLTHCEDIDALVEMLARLRSGQVRVGEVETRYLHKSGDPIWTLTRASIARDDEGKSKSIISQIEDITQRKEMERMKDEFISVVSHELRTPLTAIRGSLGVLAGALSHELSDKIRPLIDIAHKNSERLILLINDILDIDKITSGNMVLNIERENLAELVEHAMESNQSYADRFGTRFRIKQIDRDLWTDVDPNRFAQVMANLLSNAAKFSPKGGTVEVSVVRADDRARVTVRDFGEGIPKDFRNRIFDRFAQADSSSKRSRGGTGLGLHISKQIMDRLKGDIGFDTEMGVGTAFWVTLPLAEAPESEIDDKVETAARA